MASLRPGDLFANRFEIEHVAGHGGMGTVYRARDRSADVTIALKLLNTREDDAYDERRFSREVQLLADLQHPGVVTYITHGQTAEGERFIAMEWLDGEDLGRRLSRGPLGLRDALLLVQRVASTMGTIHHRGVIHRDLKPKNLFLLGGDLGRVKVLDFGIARRLVPEGGLTRTGALIGTPGYMAPEQVSGGKELTAATDVFALGCILYECLAGEPAFVAEQLYALLVCILYEEPPPITSRRQDIPQSVAVLLQRMLAKDPSQRFANAEEVAAAIAQLGVLPETPPGELALLPRRAVSFAVQEQSLISLVIANPPARQRGAARSDSLQDPALHHSLLTMLRALNVEAEFLLNGSLVTRIRQAGSATDQAVLAVRAAQIIKDAWPAAQVVVATGRGAVGATIAIGEVAERASLLLRRQLEQPVMGEVVSGIWLDELSSHLLGERFSLQPVSKGVMLLGPSREADASRPLLGKPTACVGREVELTLLETQLASCIEVSEPIALLVKAQPGVGKSRLRHEFLRRVQQRRADLTVLIGNGDMMSGDAPYGILRRAILRHCGLSGSEPMDEQRERFRECITRHLPPPEKDLTVLFLGEMCSVTFDAYGQTELQAARQDPKIMRTRIRRSFLDWLAAECLAAPVLLVVDDLQWGDALSVMLIDEAMYESQHAALCVLAFARPEVHDVFPTLWEGRRVQTVLMKDLSRKACVRLVHQVLGPNVAPAVLARIVEQSAGNALFLEELIRAAAEGATDDQPDTIMAMLQARVGLLEPGPRRLLLAASIFGQTFWRTGVGEVLGLAQNAPELDAWLSALVKQEAIEPRPGSRLANEKEYGFRHALLREATYTLLLERDRALGHSVVSHFLERKGETEAVVLAEHAQRGGDMDRAATLYARAAEQCFERHDLHGVLQRSERGLACGATKEALGQLRAMQSAAYMWGEAWPRAFETGMDALKHLTAGSTRWLRTIAYLFIIAGNLPNPEPIQQLFGLFSAVDPAISDPVAYIQAASILSVMFCFVGLRSLAQPLLERMQGLRARLESYDAISRGLTWSAEGWYAHYLEPDAYRALSCAQQAVAAFAQAGDPRQLCMAQQVVGLSLIRLGEHAAGVQALRKNLTMAQELKEPFTISMAMFYMALGIAQIPELLPEAVELANSVLRDEQNSRLVYIGGTHAIRAELYAQRGQLDLAEQEAREATATLAPLTIQRTSALTTLARILLAQGRAGEARKTADEALQIVESCGGIGFSDTAARVIAAEAHWHDHDHDGARHILQQTLDRLALSADQIPDPALRHHFLTAVPENVRAAELKRAWMQ